MKRVAVLLGLLAMVSVACGGPTPSGTGSSTQSAAAAARAELAPTGKLRLGFPAQPPFLGQQDPSSGNWRGIALSMGNFLAARLGVTLVPTRYPDPGSTYAALQSGQVDVVLAQLQLKPDTASGTAPVLRLEHTYLVKADSPLHSASEVDRSGIRVGSEKGSPHTPFLAANVKQAQVIQFTSEADGLAALTAGNVDAFAGARFELASVMTQVPGSRILDGAFFVPSMILATESSHSRGAAFLDSFVRNELSSGELQRQVTALGKQGVLAGPAT
jgi:polar amino acid transport system substrate-binding protein